MLFLSPHFLKATFSFNPCSHDLFTLSSVHSVSEVASPLRWLPHVRCASSGLYCWMYAYRLLLDRGNSFLCYLKRCSVWGPVMLILCNLFQSSCWLTCLEHVQLGRAINNDNKFTLPKPIAYCLWATTEPSLEYSKLFRLDMLSTFCLVWKWHSLSLSRRPMATVVPRTP